MIETVKLFAITYVAAFAGVVPPGLVNMTVAKTCLNQGKKSGILVAVGAAFIALIQALIALMLAKYIFNNPYVQNILLRTGVVVFILLGVYFFLSAKKHKVRPTRIPKHAGVRSLGKGVFISALNILPIPYFCTIGAALNIGGAVSYHFFAVAAFMLAASLGTFSALYLYIIGFNKIEKRSANLSKYSNYFMACLMLVLVILTLIRMYYS
ncbi:LysE family translocator [Leeuwenhoekiella sp. A16]|uniref:LysE family translocator n=1 Tax=unclassified Leeuwenhoekiella TaxID=2615029 RepID=UPI003A808A8C